MFAELKLGFQADYIRKSGLYGDFLLEQEDHHFEQLEHIGEYFVVVVCSKLRSPSSSMGSQFLKSCMVVLLVVVMMLFHFPRA